MAHCKVYKFPISLKNVGIPGFGFVILFVSRIKYAPMNAILTGLLNFALLSVKLLD